MKTFIELVSYRLFRILSNYLFCLIILPISIIIILLFPLIKIRFGPIPASVFGTYFFDTEYYLRKKTLHKEKYYDFFFLEHDLKVNNFLNKLVRRNFNISPIFKYFYLNAKILNKKNTLFLNYNLSTNKKTKCRDVDDIFFNTTTQLNFSKKEILDGKNFLKKIGLSKNQKFICIVNRDFAYKKSLNKFYDTNDKKKDWSYHYYRNSNIETYKKAAKYLIDKGYFVIRMGSVVESKLDIKNKFFFDYSCSNLKNDFLDIFLMGTSYFNLVSDVGLKDVSYVYNIPYCFVNCPFPKITPNWKSKSIFIYKKFKSKSLKRNLTFSEIKNNMDISTIKKKNIKKFIDYNAVFFFNDNPDITIVDNSSEEILDAVKEMIERLEKDLWDEKLNKYERKFWEIFPHDNNLHSKITRARICQKFIQENIELLD